MAKCREGVPPCGNLSAMRNTSREAIASNVRSLAARDRVSSRTIGTALSLSPAATSRRMNGEVEFRASELERIADLLGVPLEQLLTPDASTAAAAV